MMKPKPTAEQIIAIVTLRCGRDAQDWVTFLAGLVVRAWGACIRDPRMGQTWPFRSGCRGRACLRTPEQVVLAAGGDGARPCRDQDREALVKVGKGHHIAVDLLARLRAPRNPREAHGLDKVSDRPDRDALSADLWHQSVRRAILPLEGWRLRLTLGHPPRFGTAGGIAAVPQLGDARLDRVSPGLPHARRAGLATGRARDDADLKRRKAFDGKPDHLAQQVRIAGLLHAC